MCHFFAVLLPAPGAHTAHAHFIAGHGTEGLRPVCSCSPATLINFHRFLISQGCNRSFAELWRLKVHYRAPPDVRGSGKERGHGTELKFCPKCGKELKPGKHHVGCSAGKSAPRQAAKRQRQVSSTTESEWVTQDSFDESLEQDDASDSWEDTVRRHMDRSQRQRSIDAESSARPARSVPQAENMACRISRMQQMLTTGADTNAELVFTPNTMADFGLILRGGGGQAGGSQQPAPQQASPFQPPPPQQQQLGQHGDLSAPQQPPSGDPFTMGRTLADMHGDDPLGDTLRPLRVPSPPPLPPDWDFAGPSGPSGLLFDFDQFDASRRATHIGVSEPVMTVTSAMNPAEVSNPSDDYIWQILFAGENDPVPKRVTAHLHHPTDLQPQKRHNDPSDLSTVFDDPDPLLDAIPWPDDAKLGNGNAMQPPPPREPTRPQAADMPVPPLPAEALQMAHGQGDAAPQTVTVTYVVQPGPSGQPQYSVKSVAPGNGLAAGKGNGSADGHGNGLVPQ